jgi:CDP-glycerol glycerophosphotransferase
MIDRLLRTRSLKAGARRGVQLLRAVTPARTHVVVYGWPDHEGNSVEVVRYLLTETSTPVYWLVNELSTEAATEHLALHNDCDRLHVVRRRSLRGLLAYLTASVTFFTHGLFLNPTPSHRKVVVNLWHGDGPKGQSLKGTPPRSTYLVATSQLFGERRAANFGISRANLLVTGYPRCDQFARPCTDEGLRSLGIDPERPFVMYMPTYRSARAVGTTGAWTDTASTDSSSSGDLSITAGLFVNAARAVGWQVVVKPHPLDQDDQHLAGALLIDDREIVLAGTTTYGLLARSDALVSDYSSVWIDYLTLDRPIGFIVDDLSAYEHGRGFNVPDLVSILPGPVLSTSEDFALFFSDGLADTERLRIARKRSAEAIGLVASASPTAALFTALSERGVLTPSKREHV